MGRILGSLLAALLIAVLLLWAVGKRDREPGDMPSAAAHGSALDEAPELRGSARKRPEHDTEVCHGIVDGEVVDERVKPCPAPR